VKNSNTQKTNAPEDTSALWRDYK